MRKSLRELWTTTTGESELIPAYLYETCFEAMKKELVFRPLAAAVISNIPGSSVDIDSETIEGSNPVLQIAEGAEIPINSNPYETFNLKPLKYGIRPMVTKEMIEDSKFDVVELQLRRAGYQMAWNEDTLIQRTLAAGSSAASHDITGGSAITVANITAGMKSLENDNFKPDTLVVSPDVLYDLRNMDLFVEANKLGSTEMLQTGFVGKIYGMNVILSNNANGGTDGTATTYDAYIIDSKSAFIIAEKRPLTIEKYDDVTRDIAGIVLVQRIAARYLYKNAICRITTT